MLDVVVIVRGTVDGVNNEQLKNIVFMCCVEMIIVELSTSRRRDDNDS